MGTQEMEKTQKSVVLRHLRHYGSISAFEAITSYGITRLAARIFELKQDGYKFETERKTHKVTKKPYVRYKLTSEA